MTLEITLTLNAATSTTGPPMPVFPNRPPNTPCSPSWIRSVGQRCARPAVAPFLMLAFCAHVPTSYAAEGSPAERANTMTAAFEAIAVGGLDDRGLSEQAQSAVHEAALREKTAAFEAAQQAWVTLSDHSDPKRALLGHTGLGGLNGSMTDAMLNFSHPSSYSQAHLEVCDARNAARAAVYANQALMAFAQAREIAVQQGMTTEAGALGTHVLFFQALRADFDRENELREQASVATGQSIEAEFQKLVAHFRGRINECHRLNPKTYKEVHGIAEHAERALSEHAYDRYDLLHKVVVNYARALDQTDCSGSVKYGEMEQYLRALE